MYFRNVQRHLRIADRRATSQTETKMLFEALNKGADTVFLNTANYCLLQRKYCIIFHQC